MPSVQNICDEALRLIHVLAPNSAFATTQQGGNTVPASQDYQICLDALNAIIDGFSVDGATIYQTVNETFSLTGAASYTWGTGGNITTPRPEKIRAASVSTTDGSMPVEVVTPERFETIIDRTVTGSYADYLVCDYGYPQATIMLWPAAANGGTLNLWSYKPLAGVVYLSDVIAFPPGYLETLKFNLAVVLASEFPGAILDQWVGQKAEATNARLAQLNAVTIGAPAAPLRPVPLQQPLQEIDLEQGKPATP